LTRPRTAAVSFGNGRTRSLS